MYSDNIKISPNAAKQNISLQKRLSSNPFATKDFGLTNPFLPQHTVQNPIIQTTPNQANMIQRQAGPCHGTGRIGNLNYPGTIEHILIQQDYILNIDPGAEIEYAIPATGPAGGTGYADIKDSQSGLYEIKFFPYVSSAIAEVANYVLQAQTHCDPLANWHIGIKYPRQARIIPHTLPNKEIVSVLLNPGVIAYWVREKKPQRAPVPQRVPQTTTEQIKQFVIDVVQNGIEAEKAAEKLLKENPGIATAILVLGSIAILGLLADDLSGVGIADDAAIPVIGVLMRVAWRFAFYTR
jgi:hypothetical protein